MRRAAHFAVVVLLLLSVLATPVTTAKPIIAQLSPDRGPTEGGTSVVIKGNKLSDVTRVTFGGIDAASFTIDDAK